MAKVIILNGVSSAGKTSVARAIQILAGRPILRVGMDDFLQMMPPRYANHVEAFSFQRGETIDGAAEMAVYTGAYGARLMRGMRRSVAALAAQGLDVVVDDVMLERGDTGDYQACLEEHALYLVAVRCRLETAERRERERGDRDLGLARWQYQRVHDGVDYDLDVWTDDASPDACARDIVKAFDL